MKFFGKFLAAKGRSNALEEITQAVSEMHKLLYGEATPLKHIVDRANSAKNNLKHWDKGDPSILHLDLGEEAKDMLNRAINNYWALERKLSPAMTEFQRAIMQA